MSLRLNGSTSGYTEIDAPAVAGSNTLVLPTGNGTADQALVTNGSGTLSFADRGRMQLATAQATTSGTAIDFTGIPSWVKRITVMFNGVSTNGTSGVLIQLGTSSGFATSGYNCIFSAITGTNATSTGLTTQGSIVSGALATSSRVGSIAFSAIATNTFSYSGVTADANNSHTLHSAGLIALSGTLDRVRITTVNGTDTFDAGSVNILIEG